MKGHTFVLSYLLNNVIHYYKINIAWAPNALTLWISGSRLKVVNITSFIILEFN